MMDKINNPVLYRFDKLVDTIKNNGKMVMIGACTATILVAGLFGYRWHRQRAEGFAYHTFTAALKKFEAPVGTKSRSGMQSTDEITFKTDKEKWTAVEAAFKNGYAEHSASGLAPMFLAFEAEALCELGKHEEALALLKKALNDMKSQEIKDCYRIKYALMQLDSGKENDVKEGLELLNKISFETGSAACSQALYQLGYYHWTRNEFEKSKNYWQQYLVKYSGVPDFEQYVRFIQSKLDLIAV